MKKATDELPWNVRAVLAPIIQRNLIGKVLLYDNYGWAAGWILSWHAIDNPKFYN